jgi:hypothetical protein
VADPRLNSVHLEDPRREDFRRAREGLLNARGMQTLAGENLDRPAWPEPNPKTIAQNLDSGSPNGLKYWLVDKEYVYPLRLGLNTIGRSPDNDVVINDSYVSRRHCAILVHAGNGFELHDVASKNGTFLNGNRLDRPTHLKPGDEIRMCDRQLVFMSRSANQPSPSPTLLPTQSE